MLTTSTLRARGRDGRPHTVRIGEGYGDVRYIECDSCGVKRMAQTFARDRATEHLVEVHGVRRPAPGASWYDGHGGPAGIHQGFSVLPWVVAAAGVIVFGLILFLR